MRVVTRARRSARIKQRAANSWPPDKPGSGQETIRQGASLTKITIQIPRNPSPVDTCEKRTTIKATGLQRESSNRSIYEPVTPPVSAKEIRDDLPDLLNMEAQLSLEGGIYQYIEW